MTKKEIEEWWDNSPSLKTLAKGFLEPWDRDSDKSDNIPFKITSQQNADDKSNITEGIMFHFKGYGDCGSGEGHGIPILMEMKDGEVRIVVWSDINKEDYTHDISLRFARDSEYKD